MLWAKQLTGWPFLIRVWQCGLIVQQNTNHIRFCVHFMCLVKSPIRDQVLHFRNHCMSHWAIMTQPSDKNVSAETLQRIVARSEAARGRGAGQQRALVLTVQWGEMEIGTSAGSRVSVCWSSAVSQPVCLQRQTGIMRRDELLADLSLWLRRSLLSVNVLQTLCWSVWETAGKRPIGGAKAHWHPLLKWYAMGIYDHIAITLPPLLRVTRVFLLQLCLSLSYLHRLLYPGQKCFYIK